MANKEPVADKNFREQADKFDESHAVTVTKLVKTQDELIKVVGELGEYQQALSGLADAVGVYHVGFPGCPKCEAMKVARELIDRK